MLSALLMLSLLSSLPAQVRCKAVRGKQLCYSVDKGYIENLIRKYAGAFGVDPELALQVAKKESDLDPFAVSPKGAVGVMQLMPETAKALGVDPWDLEENIKGGVAYLKMLLDRFNGNVDLALAAYNAGPKAVERHKGVPPYGETRQFVTNIKKDYRTATGTSKIRVVRLPDGTLLITNMPLELVR